jgi:two-component system response regulator HydG
MPGRILIVDDDSSLCDLIESDLRLRGLEPRGHTRAEEAFEALKAEDFDVVLTDLRMPGMDGIDLCTRIVANRPDIPVIVTTAFGSLDTAIRALRAGAFDFVTKPINLARRSEKRADPEEGFSRGRPAGHPARGGR